MPSFFVENFGCRATQADGAAIERQFRDRGLARALAPANAELVILNTCTVTAAADQDARAAIRRIHRQNPNCQIVVTGCYAQRAPHEIASLPGVSQVVGNSHKQRLAEIALPRTSVAKAGLGVPHSARLKPCPDTNPQSAGFVPLGDLTANDQRLTTNDSIFVSDIFAHTELLAAPVFDAANERTRPNLKVQDGCDNRCSFCVIPYVRGQSRSLQLDEILREVNALVAAGYREVVISGINLGRWGRDLPSGAEARVFSATNGTTEVVPSRMAVPARTIGQRPTTNDQRLRFNNQRPFFNDQRLLFEDLIHSILEETSLEKLRLSSVEPMDWTDELIAMMATSPRIAKHAHVPMQSGSDAVLRRMHRKYRPWHYQEKLEKIRAAMPTAAIGADVMAGFPGETDAEFEETRRMIESLPFTYLHVFTYSPRPGTPAAAMRNQVPVQVARERNRILRDLAAQKKQAFMQSFVGKKVEAITLGMEKSRTGVSAPHVTTSTEALTDNYLKLQLHGHHVANRWIQASVEQVVDETLIGVADPSSN